MGAPIWGPQEIVQASVLCPGHVGSHMGTPGVPSSPVSRPWVVLGSFFPKILGWKSSSLLRVHPKGGMAWGSTLWVPNLGAAPISQPAKPSHVVMGGEIGV